ncbi:MAG: hypothetical protein ACUVYA_01370 [Planctomycetota bacterium]
MAGTSRSKFCDPGIHFADIQSSLGRSYAYRTLVHQSYYDHTLDGDRDCRCYPATVSNPCACLSTFTTDQMNVFRDAIQWISGTSPIPDAEFTDVGFLAWHDHTASIRNYANVDNHRRYTVAFSDGCSDGGFAGWPPGSMARFAPTSADGHDLPYVTEDGRLLKVVFDARYPVDTNGDGVLDTNDTKYYCILGCDVDGRRYPRSGDHFDDISPARPFPYPDLRVADDFGRGCAMNPSALPVSGEPRYLDELPYIYDAPRSAPPAAPAGRAGLRWDESGAEAVRPPLHAPERDGMGGARGGDQVSQLPRERRAGGLVFPRPCRPPPFGRRPEPPGGHVALDGGALHGPGLRSCHGPL